MRVQLLNGNLKKESWPKDNPIKFDDTEVGPDYIISGSMMTFYNVDTPEKRLKMIKLFEELKTK